MRCDEQLWYWWRMYGRSWPGVHVFAALAEAFLERVEIAEPDQARRGPVLYLANHQTYLESVLFGFVTPALTGRPVVTLAKAAHRNGWLGCVEQLITSHPATRAHRAMVYYDVDDPASIHDVCRRLTSAAEAGSSILVHVEGTRHRSAQRGRVRMVAPLWADLALRHQLPIVPVRFVGGLPVEDQGRKFDLPVGHGATTIRLGPAVLPEQLAALAPEERAAELRSAINTLQDPKTEQPGTPDPTLAAEAAEWSALTGADPVGAAMLVALGRYLAAGRARAETGGLARIVAAARAHRAGPAAFHVPDDDSADWWARLAWFLHGPGGPDLVVDRASRAESSAV